MRHWPSRFDAIVQSKPPPAIVDHLKHPVAIHHGDFGGHRIQDDVLESFAFLQNFFPLRQDFQQAIEAADQFADFIVTGNGQGLWMLTGIGPGR